MIQRPQTTEQIPSNLVEVESQFWWPCFQAAETFMNLKQLVELVHLQEYLHYTFAGDLKVLNLVTGLECHSSLYPCPYYLSPSNAWISTAPLRTLNLNAEAHELWRRTSGKKAELKFFIVVQIHPSWRAKDLSCCSAHRLPFI